MLLSLYLSLIFLYMSPTYTFCLYTDGYAARGHTQRNNQRGRADGKVATVSLFLC